MKDFCPALRDFLQYIGQKSFKFVGSFFGKLMISSIHSDLIWPLAATYLFSSNKINVYTKKNLSWKYLFFTVICTTSTFDFLKVAMRWNQCYQFFINEKFKKIFHLFTCILPNYVPHEITKEFWKISHFWNMTASFLWGVKTHFGEKYAWFAIEILLMEANLSFGYVMVPKNNQKII